MMRPNAGACEEGRQMQTRSTFVTVVAWIFIVLSSFGTVIGILQNVLLWTVFRTPEVTTALEEAQAASPEMPVIVSTMFQYMPLFFLATLLVTVFTLVSSIGLLRRWNPARLCFIGIMILGALWTLVGMVFQFYAFSEMRTQMAEWSSEIDEAFVDMSAFTNGMMVVQVVFSLAFVALFLWIAKRLLSPQIAAEFRH